jgi:hypothetical protein
MNRIMTLLLLIETKGSNLVRESCETQNSFSAINVAVGLLNRMIPMQNVIKTSVRFSGNRNLSKLNLHTSSNIIS